VSTFAVVVIVVLGVLVLLAVGGYVASGRRAARRESTLQPELEAANQALATAHAQDRGWERSLLEEAARSAFAERSGASVRELQLVQVVDRPGTDEDEAVFRVVTDHGSEYLHLDRRGDRWVSR
jgi:type II secretory pathway pseudopilin PulG